MKPSEWKALSNRAKAAALRNHTQPQLTPPLDSDRLPALQKSLAEHKGGYGLSWALASVDGSIHTRAMKPCWGTLVLSAHRNLIQGLVVDMGVPSYPWGQKEETPLFREWYRFIMSGIYPGIADDTIQISDKTFAVMNTNYPVQLLINYLIALRIPYRNTPAVRRWYDWVQRGATPLGAFVLASFVSNAGRPDQFMWQDERAEYPLTGWQYVRGRGHFGRLATGEPLLGSEFAFQSGSRGIPNNTIWETRGRPRPFLPSEITEKIKGGIVFETFDKGVAQVMLEAVEEEIKRALKQDRKEANDE